MTPPGHASFTSIARAGTFCMIWGSSCAIDRCMIITAHAHARAGLVGNPSDGYFGKTISFIIRNFRATVHLWESPHFEIVPTHGDLARFASVNEFLRDQKLHGYYGGLRLIKAIVKKFHEHCRASGIH